MRSTTAVRAKKPVPSRWERVYPRKYPYRFAGTFVTGSLVTGSLVTGGVTAGGRVGSGLDTGGVTTGGLVAGGVTAGGLVTGGVTTGGLVAGGRNAVPAAPAAAYAPVVNAAAMRAATIGGFVFVIGELVDFD